MGQESEQLASKSDQQETIQMQNSEGDDEAQYTNFFELDKPEKFIRRKKNRKQNSTCNFHQGLNIQYIPNSNCKGSRGNLWSVFNSKTFEKQNRKNKT